MKNIRKSILTLITESSTRLPADVSQALTQAQEMEGQYTQTALALATIDINIEQAQQHVRPLCQDTGMLTFWIHFPSGMDTIYIEQEIREAIKTATDKGILRPNSVDSLTGINPGDNLGTGMPVIHWIPWPRKELEIRLLLKGGGCENKNAQYSLPCTLEGLGKAGRDLDGVRKCILDSIFRAQGQGCGAGFLGVCIGGDRTSGYETAKEQLLRPVHQPHPNPKIAELETYIVKHANQLGIGTMGFGGEVTLLGCAIEARHRIPASFFVSVAYNCWAFRRQGILLNPETGEITQWLYPKAASPRSLSTLTTPTWDVGPHQKVVRLQTPISEETIRQLRVGDVVLLSGALHTGRDRLHQYLMENSIEGNYQNSALYHCGPVVLQNAQKEWSVQAAGPTTSIREEPYQAQVIADLGFRVIIGKGGMGQKTLQALKKHGAVYLNAIGGAAQYYAHCITKVLGVDFLFWGVPEALWHFEVKDFPAIVTMDAHGDSLHTEIEKSSFEKLKELADPVF